MTKRKLQIMLAAITLSVTLAACGGGSSDQPVDANGENATNVTTPGNAANGATGNGTNTNTESAETSGEIREIVIKGSNFEFDQEEYTISVGETVKLIYQNEEGNHGIFVEGVDVRLRNNEEKVVTFSEAGTFEMICTVYCGAGHAGMKSKIIVQ